jgi:PAS domain S-box-containing protein
VLFSSIGEGVIVTDDKGLITRVNATALKILGYQESELIGKWFTAAIVGTYEDGSIISPMDRPVTKAIVTGQTVTARTSYRRADRSLVPVYLTVSPIVHKGKPTGAIELFRDTTEDIRADKMMTDFISVASHQLRTPLSAINIYSRMLNDGMAGELNSEQSSFIKSILTSIDRMNHLINILLNITRIEAGGINVKISRVHLHELAQDILDENMPSARKKGVELINNIDSKTPLVATDALLVKEIYANLMSNAIKYTPEGGVITVSLDVQDDSIVFGVQDTGFGIPAAAQEHIFTKFFRADNILSEDVSGTGLGLYLTQTIAESLNGELWFESEENVGTQFYFSLSKQGSMARSGRFKLEG